MNRFDGNTILITDGDKIYGSHLAEALTSNGATCFYAQNLQDAKTLLNKYDFDLVISNYYLSDGVIHQMIDWCSDNLPSLPIFTCIGYPLIGDSEIYQKHSISDVFSKNDSRRIFTGLSKLLFDFNQFHESLLEMITPTEVLIEIKVGTISFLVRPIEINHDSLNVYIDSCFDRGTFGVLKFSIGHGENNQTLIIPGFFENKFSDGQIFRINKKYISNWMMFINFLDKKQMNITHFMKKASGING